MSIYRFRPPPRHTARGLYIRGGGGCVVTRNCLKISSDGAKTDRRPVAAAVEKRPVKTFTPCRRDRGGDLLIYRQTGVNDKYIYMCVRTYGIPITK